MSPQPTLKSPTPRPLAPWPARHLFGQQEKEAVNRLLDECIATGKPIGYGGTEEAAYGSAFAKFLGGGYADAVNSGTNALYIALAALELPPGSEVIVPPITDAGGIMPVSLLRCTPVVADTAPGSFNVGAEEMAAQITPRTRAIVVMHAAGLPVDLEPVLELARQHGLKVVEDCAQAHGSLYRGKPVGSFGDIAAFSTMFGKTHAFGGQGGVVFTRDEALAHRIREYADRGKPSGRPPGTRNVVASLNFNADELHCAIGRVQLAKLPEIIRKRRELGNAIAEGCRKLSHIRMVTGGADTEPAYWYLLFRFDAGSFRVPKAEFVARLASAGLPFEPDYNFIPSDYEWYCKSGFPPPRLPNARKAVEEHFRMLFHENLTAENVRDVVDALHRAEAEFRR